VLLRDLIRTYKLSVSKIIPLIMLYNSTGTEK